MGLCRKLVIATIFMSLLGSTSSVMAGELTDQLELATAWQKIIADNDRLQAMREEVVEAKHQQDGAADLYWPEVSVSASYLYLDDDITLSPSQILDSMAGGDQLGPVLASMAAGYGMTMSQLDNALTVTIADRDQATSSISALWPLYTGGRITAAQDAAQGKVHEADNRLLDTKREQFESLVRYYFSVVLAGKILTTRQEVESGLRQHRDHSVLLEAQGQIARVERMQAEAALDKATVERKKAGRDLEIAGAALSRMLKTEQSVEPVDGLFLNETLPAMSGFINSALAGYPGLAILRAKREQAEALVKSEKGKYHPTLAAFGNYSLYEEESLATELMPDWIVGVSLNLPILDRSGRSGKLAAAQSTIRRIDLLMAQARSDISLLVEKNYRQAQQALEEYEGLGSSLQLAKVTVDLRKKAFNQGVSTSLDVVDAEMFLASVKTQRAAASYHYIRALAALCGAAGQPERFFQFQQQDSIGVQ